jgi:hypothetical protein
MPAELIKIFYLQLETGGDDNRDEFTDAPILNNLDSLLPLLSNKGLYSWARHVFSNLERWEPEAGSAERYSYDTLKEAALDAYSKEIDDRFQVPSDKNEIKRVLSIRDGWGCACRRGTEKCGYPMDAPTSLTQYELAHLIPTSLGGPHKWSNLALMNPACNRSQGDKMFRNWLEEQPYRNFSSRSRMIWKWSANVPKSGNEEDLITSVCRWPMLQADLFAPLTGSE